VIRVRVPFDLHTVVSSGCGAFACATPLRISEVLALAVREAIGLRAPQDKFHRTMHATLAGLRSKRFVVEIDGRRFDDTEAIVVCSEVASVRFFMPARQPVRR